MRGAAFGHGLVDQVCYGQQPATQLRAMSESFIQTLVNAMVILRWQFVIHELLNYTQYRKVQGSNCLTVQLFLHAPAPARMTDRINRTLQDSSYLGRWSFFALG